MDTGWKIHATLGYACMIVLAGLPMWLITTKVDRADWPYQDIQELPQQPRLTVNLLLVSDDAQQGGHVIGPDIQSLLGALDQDLITYDLRSRVASESEKRACLKAQSLSDLDTMLGPLHSKLMQGVIVLFESPGHLFEESQIVQGQYRSVFFKYGQTSATSLVDTVRQLVGDTALSNALQSIQNPRHQVNSAWILRRPVAIPSFDILFSLLVPEPESCLPDWDIESALQTYISPLIQDLSTIYDFTVKSQVLYLTRLNLKSQDGAANFVNKQDLSLAIDMESQLTSHASSRHTLNFVTYFPTEQQSPLHILDDQGAVLHSNAFLVPRWGGVAILNSTSCKVDEAQVMSIFGGQLKRLLGLLENELSFSLTDMEKDFLYRLGLVENLATARVTLTSLSHLLTKIPNIVITEEIAQEGKSAVQDFQEAIQLAKLARLKEAYLLSKSSHISSDKVFYDNTLLALLYFPEDQKYAIYIPLFLPITFSFFGSLFPILKQRMWKKKP